MAGVDVEHGIDLEDAIDLTGMMVAMERVPPASKWVEAAIADTKVEAVEGLF